MTPAVHYQSQALAAKDEQIAELVAMVERMAWGIAWSDHTQTPISMNGAAYKDAFALLAKHKETT